ncbi:uncharacterized protein LAJ45_08212 [Morchella importuna]|uniref:uncharacterized protein n=1 Tax=Morchella importuna TaxID=1174673 RepID=UPI001E8EA0F8|nr:uncharacterized protein LAJ45_08212 [Morchella importuna]KAH8147747.1 hypothetical protein LAJ45_08212 [Morchella importuna]
MQSFTAIISINISDSDPAGVRSTSQVIFLCVCVWVCVRGSLVYVFSNFQLSRVQKLSTFPIGRVQINGTVKLPIFEGPHSAPCTMPLKPLKSSVVLTIQERYIGFTATGGCMHFAPVNSDYRQPCKFCLQLPPHGGGGSIDRSIVYFPAKSRHTNRNFLIGRQTLQAGTAYW